jgi:prepilin-type N-terminal cleavage/methylation domain-containing protein
MSSSKQNGFTLVEFLTAISILCIILPAFLPGYISAKCKVKEVEAKANLHTIQIAVERYNTDHPGYPPFLLGGDMEGWKNWHRLNDEDNPDPNLPANKWVYDPLIEFGYMITYPKNPFIDWDSGYQIINATSFISNPGLGDGDPRFGCKGYIMGNGLDDPFFFEDAHPNLPYSRIETRRTLDRGKFDPKKYGFPSKDAPTGFYPGLYYNFGGRYNPSTGKEIITFWPGDFFYQSYSRVEMISEPWNWALPYPNTVRSEYADMYLLGVWGDQRNPGKDVIRLQEVTPDENQDPIYWRLPDPFPAGTGIKCGYTGRIGEPLGLPAVLGGGDKINGPSWPPSQIGPFWPPYQRDVKSENYPRDILGAPDGVKDGIILVLNSGAVRTPY